MKISTKIMLICIPLLMITLVLGGLGFSQFSRGFVAAQEKSQMESLTVNVASHLESRLQGLLNSAMDWSHWNEPFDYLGDANPDFVENNLSGSTFEYLGIELVAIYDYREARISDALRYDLTTREAAPFPGFLSDWITRYAEDGSARPDQSMILENNGRFYFIAAAQITDMEQMQPSRGLMFFGKEVDRSILDTLIHESGALVMLANAGRMDSSLMSRLGSAADSDDPVVVSIPDPDKKSMDNYLLFQQRSSLSSGIVLYVQADRSFYFESIRRFNLLILYAGATVLLLFVFLFFLLRRFISDPLQNLTKEVSAVPTDARILPGQIRISSTGPRDEISQLASTIESLFGRVSAYQGQLAESEALFRAMFEEAPVGIGLVSFHSRKILRMNRKYAEILHRTPEELFAMTWDEFTHPDDLDDNHRRRDDMLAARSGGFSLAKRYLAPDGSVIWANVKVVLLDSPEEPEARELCMIEDITEKMDSEDKILYLSYHDVLTGLYNRRFFEEEKRRLDTERQIPLSVIIADLDGLKLVNDGFGYASGDMMLKEAAIAIKGCCRTEDIIARIGGDEFCVLLPKTSAGEAQAIARRMVECFKNRPLDLGGTTVNGSISVGYACKTEPGTPMEEIIANAEDSMRKGKLLSRKSVRSDLLSSIKTALFEKSHETADHAERMAALSLSIGEALGLPDDVLRNLELAATLHDIGKMSIDHQILAKPGPLTESEWQIVKRHPEVGYRIACATSELEPIADYILCHHERWDGSGYPQGLKEESIPLISRIIAIVDAFDAMTEFRTYRDALTRQEAIRTIKQSAGTQFDPAIVEIFTRVVGS